MSSLKLKKRWFVLTHNSLDYYKSSEKNALKLGTLVLNSLCSVVPPDEKVFKETGNWGHVPAANGAETAHQLLRVLGLLGAKEWDSYQERVCVLCGEGLGVGVGLFFSPQKEALFWLTYLPRLSVLSYVNS